jgi:HlyD family secretion protein
MNKKIKYSIWIIIFLIVGYALWSLGFKKTDSAIEVKVGKVERRTIVQTVAAVGRIEPETEVKISSETSGELISLPIKEGDTVHTGQVLGKIKPDIFQTQLEQSRAGTESAKMEIESQKANLTQSKSNFERIKELYAKDFASLQELEIAKANYEQAQSGHLSALARLRQSEASLAQVERNAERTTIYSPIDGIVTSLGVEIGEKILGTAQFQGTEMMKVADLSVINATVDVDENDIVLVKVGDSATVEIDAFPDSVFNAYVFEIGHSAQITAGQQDQVTNFKVKLRLVGSNQQIRPGMSCSVGIKTKISENTLSVPLTSVTVRVAKKENIEENSSGPRKVKKDKDNSFSKNEPPSPVVFAKEGNRAIMKKVEIGISDRGFIEVLSGLEEGMEIITGSYRAVSKEIQDSSEVKLESKDGKKWSGRKSGK